MGKKKFITIQVLFLIVALLLVSCRQLWHVAEDDTTEVDPDATKVLVTDITIYDHAESSVLRGQTIQLATRIEPHNATNQAVAWYIDTTVEGTTGEATVDQHGLLTGVADGTVFVVAQATDTSGVASKPHKVEVTQPPFVLTYDIPEGGMTNFALPLRSAGAVYDLIIDWGDGSALTNVTQGSDAVHTYDGTVTGYVDISITGDLRFGDIDANGSDDGSFGDGSIDGAPYESSNSTLVGVKSFGDVQFINNLATFANVYRNFTLPADKTDIPYLKGSVSHMFSQAWTFNQSIDHFDTSEVTSLQQLFYRAREFNQDISSWNISGVSNMNNMFLNAKSFNQNMSTWSNWAKREHVSYVSWLHDTPLKDGDLVDYLPPGFDNF